MKHYSIAAVLPHLRVFGGIRRYLSLGSVWHAWGHEVVLYTPDGAPSEWLPFPGSIRPFSTLSMGAHDVAFTRVMPCMCLILARTR